MNGISFWETVDPSTLWHGVLFLILCVCAYWGVQKLLVRAENRRQDMAFYALVDKIGLDAEEETRLVDLLEKQKIGRPARVLESLKEYDLVAERAISAILTAEEVWPERLKAIDKIYSARSKVDQFLLLAEHREMAPLKPPLKLE
ncbi:MAG TPA: hypothetical protein PKH07_16700 [bacterium]|nr:hypothetical protein [bacterium]